MAHPKVRFHFMPTYSSWLNQVEIWFSKLQREVIDRGIFTSVTDLRRKIMRYIRLYGKSAKPFRWKYSDPRCRIQPWQMSLADCPLGPVDTVTFKFVGAAWVGAEFIDQ